MAFAHLLGDYLLVSQVQSVVQCWSACAQSRTLNGVVEILVSGRLVASTHISPPPRTRANRMGTVLREAEVMLTPSETLPAKKPARPLMRRS